jgi:hypothetical protein
MPADVLNQDIELKISNRLLLDFLLMKIRSKSIAYATTKKKNLMKKEKDLISEIKLYEKKKKIKENKIMIF